MNNEELLARFNKKSEFIRVAASWTETEKLRFCQLVRIVHNARLDWWHVEMDNEIRFGRKEISKERAVRTLGRLTGDKYQRITIPIQLGTINPVDRALLGDELLKQLEQQLSLVPAPIPEICYLNMARKGNWPDEIIA